MRMSKKLLSLAIITICFLLSTPAISAELNLGGGTPLWGTHTDDDTNHFDGGWLIFASIDRKVEARKWLSYGLMYNYTRIRIGVEDINTETTKIDECYDYHNTSNGDYNGCYYLEVNNGYNGRAEVVTTTKTGHEWLSIHVLGPYAKPTWQMTKRLKAFTMIGGGLMYVDGKIYGDELGGAGFVSAGLGLDITEHLGIAAQMLYVQGFTSHVNDIKYYAPVATISYRW